MRRKKWFSVIGGGGFIALGVGGMALLAGMKEAPAEAKSTGEEGRLHVEAIAAVPGQASVTLKGFGEVRSIRTVPIASEVTGTIVQTHPRLVTGQVVRAGELLFAVDPRPYQAALEEAQARIAECDSQIQRLETEYAHERDRMGLIERTRDLAQARYERARKLHSEAIGNQTDADDAEGLYNEAVDTFHLLDRQVKLYPLRIEEARQQRAAQAAARELAALNLAYATVTASFDCRIADVQVEAGQHVSAGQPALVLADDSTLEISVKLDAEEARTWLKFADGDATDGMAWFGAVERVSCEVRWAEGSGEAAWTGVLDRIEQFDAETRAVAVVVRVTAEQACGGQGRPPLVAGMFCETRIPGRVLDGVYTLPQRVLTLDQTVRVARAGHLASVPVELIRQEADVAYVRGELGPDDLVITTRLINPIENSLVDVQQSAPETE